MKEQGMRATIYYFSSTGNSLTIARQIAKEIGDCDIRSMAATLPEGSVGGIGNPIGFVFPVYYNALPRLVARFVRALNILPDTYCFAFATYGATAADTIGMLDDILKEKGIGLSYGAGARMPGNYIVEYQAFRPATVERLIKNALASADEASKEIAQGVKKPIRRKLKILSRATSRWMLHKNISGWDKRFQVTDKCTSCGLCSEICPVSNIILVEGHPVWQHHCERCVGCIQWCPAEAIQYGHKTIGRRRYRFPGVSATGIIGGAQGKSKKDVETKTKKETIREEIRLKESQLSLVEKKAQDKQIYERLIQLEEYELADTVFCFVGTEHEIDTKQFILTSLSLGKSVAVPLCMGKGIMEARKIMSMDDLHIGFHGLWEPNSDCPVIGPECIDFAVVPCVSCDKQGYRIGQGGGYYDRYLPKLRCASAVVCREELMTEAVPVEAHDVAASIVVTEKKILRPIQ